MREPNAWLRQFLVRRRAQTKSAIRHGRFDDVPTRIDRPVVHGWSYW